MVLYNDIDPKACAWLRELIAHGHIADGVVDNRSILDIRPEELAGYTQVHYFAGIGGWSLALRWAGWPDDRPVWTGSCPCQPLSCAGQRKGHADERHLWPAFYSLIAECRPPVVFGEQVASADGREWLAGVRADLEGTGYALGGADLCAAGVGAPHRRQRLFWVGALVHADRAGQREQCRAVAVRPQHASAQCSGGFDGKGRMLEPQGCRADNACRLGDPEGRGCRVCGDASQPGSGGHIERTGWAGFETVHCRDGKTRRFEPGSFPLAHGLPGRVGLLRGYGNAIVPQVAAEFIQAFTEIK